MDTKILWKGLLLFIPVFIIALFCGYYATGLMVFMGLVFHASVMAKLFGKPEDEQ